MPHGGRSGITDKWFPPLVSAFAVILVILYAIGGGRYHVVSGVKSKALDEEFKAASSVLAQAIVSGNLTIIADAIDTYSSAKSQADKEESEQGVGG
jgi:hypothetical protein